MNGLDFEETNGLEIQKQWVMPSQDQIVDVLIKVISSLGSPILRYKLGVEDLTTLSLIRVVKSIRLLLE